jgi:XisH protein
MAIMSARDKYHDAVKNALIRDGWTITHDPYRIAIGRRRGYIDLGAEMPLAAEKEGRRIAVEMRSFLGASELDDLEEALGQYGVYRVTLAKHDPGRTLYPALPADVQALLLHETDCGGVGSRRDSQGAHRPRLPSSQPPPGHGIRRRLKHPMPTRESHSGVHRARRLLRPGRHAARR